MIKSDFQAYDEGSIPFTRSKRKAGLEAGLGIANICPKRKIMRPLNLTILVSGLLASAAAFSSAAQTAQSNVGPCVDVQVGNEHVSDLDCINQKLRKLSVQSQSGIQFDAPIGAASSTTQAGTANQAAAQQMMGNAFGKSAQPQRPHPTYVTPLAGVPAAH